MERWWDVLLMLYLFVFSVVSKHSDVFPLVRSKQGLSPENKAKMERHEFSLYIRPKGKLFIGLQRLQ